MSVVVESLAVDGGAVVEIVYDDSPENPRDWGVGTLRLRHRRYHLPFEGDEPGDDAIVVMTVYGYDHGQLCISTKPFSCPWDSGVLGTVHIDRREVLGLFPSWKRLTKARIEKVRELLSGQVDIYNCYLTCDTYAVIVRLPSGDVCDAVGGFYGLDSARGEAKVMAEAARQPSAVEELDKVASSCP